MTRTTGPVTRTEGPHGPFGPCDDRLFRGLTQPPGARTLSAEGKSVGGTVDLVRGMANADLRAIVTAAAVTAVGLAVSVSVWTPAGEATTILLPLTVVIASGCFLAAGIYRLARWRMVGDPHSGLVGSALMVMGGLALPSGLLVNLGADHVDVSLAGPACRGVASFIAMALVLRALRSPGLGTHETPAWVLPTACAVFAGTFVSAVAVEFSLGSPTTTAGARVVIVVLIAAGWASLAVVTRRHAARLPWAGRVSPLLAGMAAAETLRAAGLGEINAWTLSGVMLSATMGALAMRSALADLDRATQATQYRQQHLSQQLGIFAGDVENYDRWRSDVRHDARNTCAGLRAAMTLLYPDGNELRPELAAQLRAAAVTELQQLEDLLTSDTTDAEELDLVAALDLAIAPLRLLGAAITVTAPPTRVLGDRADLVLVVRDLLMRSFSDTPANEVTLSVHPGVRTTRIRYAETCPVASRSGNGAELAAVRHLLRRHGGDLELSGGPAGGLLELTLPTPQRTATVEQRFDDPLVEEPV